MPIMTIQVDFKLCTDILDACREARRYAYLHGVNVRFDFNGVDMLVTPFSKPEECAEKYRDSPQSLHDTSHIGESNKISEVKSMLKAVLDAWKNEADQGDGIMRKHGPLFWGAMKLSRDE